MTLFHIAKSIYRSHAYMYPHIFNRQQREMAVLRSKMKYVHDSDFYVLSQLQFPERPFVVDVGANFGQSIGSIRTILGNSRIAAFEPNPTAFQKITKLYGADENVELFNFALGRETSTIEFSIPMCRGICFDQLASITDKSSEAIAQFLRKEGFTWVDSSAVTFEQTKVQVRELDSFHFAPHIIKIDVEGTEYDVIQGALRTIETFRPVLLVESGERPEIVAVLRNLGYARYLFENGEIVAAESRTSINSIFLTKYHCWSLLAASAEGSQKTRKGPAGNG